MNKKKNMFSIPKINWTKLNISYEKKVADCITSYVLIVTFLLNITTNKFRFFLKNGTTLKKIT